MITSADVSGTEAGAQPPPIARVLITSRVGELPRKGTLMEILPELFLAVAFDRSRDRMWAEVALILGYEP